MHRMKDVRLIILLITREELDLASFDLKIWKLKNKEKIYFLLTIYINYWLNN